MMQMVSPATQAKAKAKLAKARTKWNWKIGKARGKKSWLQLRMKPKQSTINPVLGTIIGGAAGLLAIYAAASAMGRRKKTALAQRGQAPSRSHVQLASHPAAQSRFEPVKRMFGMA